ncbi:glycosyltransferase family 4 protein [Faecalibacterium sp. An192]|uniref:glycosyltransferase family 4 protein n=1 Tax=Faecalibacterium sp. An192 TaxID=1965581 RepID=UPI000B394188|nr:glycosyltransferase family 4 protein [Faecalibacterium sp. An192]OUP27852.1 glycosyltransferase family 1 protein [Faecalibacterium sp. An192]
MKKVLFVATVVKTHIMEFHVPYLKMFKEMGWETAVAARNDYENPADCVIPYCDTYYNIPFERNPLKIGNLKAYKNLKKVIDNGGYDIIHCHTPVGAMLTRLAAKRARKNGTKVFYTAHGFHFYTGAPIINWILYYPVERWLAHYTDVLITINQEDYKRAQKFQCRKVIYIPGVGIDLSKFNTMEFNRDRKREELGISHNSFVILSVGELIPRKNHKIVLEALSILKNIDKISDIQYLICGNGRLKKDLKQLTLEYGISEHVHFLGYRNDVSEMYKCSDLFVFMSKQEGLPVALMEAMACGVPIICSNVRGNRDLVENKYNGIIIKLDPQLLSEKILELKSNEKDKKIYLNHSLEKIKHFELSYVLKEMKDIYEGQ